MQPYINTIKPILFEHCESQDDSIRNLVAECLGKLYLSSAVEMMNEIQSHIQ